MKEYLVPIIAVGMIVFGAVGLGSLILIRPSPALAQQGAYPSCASQPHWSIQGSVEHVGFDYLLDECTGDVWIFDEGSNLWRRLGRR